MQPHYNAFISYRHHPEDIRVATQIHRLLERFPVPKSLKKQGKSIQKLFRDKDELPISSNLSDDIYAALQNSDYLIVICSVHTKESLWVQREIETFLQSHSRDRVLTVLVNGEPYEVIPEILLHETLTDPVTGEKRQIPLEPLSCDWRMPLRKARKEELPRLAAALLHCSYDELRQRQKQYRMQKLLIAGSAALVASLGLTAYFLYTSITIRNANIQIQANYTQALKNQSQYLTTAAQERMEAGDRLTALQLLLEALPSQEDSRPYVPGAEHLLAAATGAYATGEEYVARGAMIPNAGAVVEDFLLSEDGSLIYLQDSRNVITRWDPLTLLQETSISCPQLEEMIAITPRGDLLVEVTEDYHTGIRCYGQNGQLLWEQMKCIDQAFWGEDALLMLTTDQELRTILRFLDLTTGEEVREPIPLTEPNALNGPTGLLQDSYRSDDPISLLYGDPGYETRLLDVDTALIRPLTAWDRMPTSITTTEAGQILVMVPDGSGMMNGRFLNMFTTSPSRSDIYCYDAASGKPLWQSEITSYQYSGTDTLCPIPDSETIFCQSGNTLQIISARDGSLISRCDTVGGIIHIAWVKAANAFGVLDNGQVFRYDFEENSCYSLDYNVGTGLRKAVHQGELYALVGNDTQVTVYHYLQPQLAWQKDMAEDFYISRKYLLSGNNLAYLDYKKVHLFRLDTQEPLWSQDGEFLTLVGFSQDGTQLWLTDEYKLLICLDTVTGQRTDHSLPQEQDGSFLIMRSIPVMEDGRFWYLASQEQSLVLVSYDPQSQSTQLHQLPELSDQDSCRILKATPQAFWILTDPGELYLYQRETGTGKVLLEGIQDLPSLAIQEDTGIAAVTYGSQILRYTALGEPLPSFTLPEGEPGSLHYQGQELLVLCDTAMLYRLDDQGSILSFTGLGLVPGELSYSLTGVYRDPMDITWHTAPDGRLILYTFGVANIIDQPLWECTASVENCFAYHPESDSFLSANYGSLSAYPRFTLPQLRTLAQEQLGQYQLTQEDRKAFGLN